MSIYTAGIYCGPLRLLAWEVSNTLRHPSSSSLFSSPLLCDLLTGQERDLQLGAQHLSCTVEMCPLDRVFSCAVLDEAQLLGDVKRGWAWTQVIIYVYVCTVCVSCVCHMCVNDVCE